MEFRTLLKSAVPPHFKEALKRDLGVPSIDRTLRMMRANGFIPGVVLDIGAYQGEWMELCKDIWPNSTVLMIEGSPERTEKLRSITMGRHDVVAHCALLGASEKTAVRFYEQDSASSALPESAKADQSFVTLPMKTLDEVTRGTTFQKPDFIKLDVQGYEIEVLKGGTSALNSAQAILLEVNLIPIYRDAPLLQDVVEFMAENDFRAYDIASLIRRPLDGALWQADMVFVRNDSPLLASSSYGN